MPTIAEVRQKFPQYNDLSDTELGDALYSKFYSDMDRGDFNRRIGLDNPPKQDPAGVRPANDAPNPYGFMDESVNAFARAMKDKLYTNDMRDATASVWNRRTREVFNELFRTPQDRANFERFMSAERGQIATRNAVSGNSTTAAQLADMAEEQGGGQGAAGYLLDQFRGGAVSGVANIARDALGRAGGLNERSGAEIARLLLGQAPDAQAAILRSIAERQASQQASAQSRAALGRLLSRGLIAGTVPQ
ncbi:hypothetical protein FO470_17255 [Starkeya sp. 3C]|uniref:Uncharacterized protein n=1 Tax=Ancylobacter moscoviensis TaxID=2597768 RepID=A0ABY3DS79_9HYPH|nr:hypothetical protein [Ancylobacter moscoviensis]TSJ60499.1 hypothetical protein FO470_17255 [Ancylobacter moscoviensis]